METVVAGLKADVVAAALLLVPAASFVTASTSESSASRVAYQRDAVLNTGAFQLHASTSKDILDVE